MKYTIPIIFILMYSCISINRGGYGIEPIEDAYYGVLHQNYDDFNLNNILIAERIDNLKEFYSDNMYALGFKFNIDSTITFFRERENESMTYHYKIDNDSIKINRTPKQSWVFYDLKIYQSRYYKAKVKK